MSKKPIIITIIISLLFIVATGGGVWYWQKTVTDQEKTDLEEDKGQLEKKIDELDKKISDESKEKEDKEKKESKESSNVKYTDSQYGFELTFPDAWKYYGTEDALMDDSGGMVTDGKTIYFGLPAKEINTIYDFGFNRYYASPFAISIYTKAQWETSKNQEFAPKKIADDNDYVFTYSQANGTLSIKGMTQEQAYSDIDIIIDTFKLI